MGQVKTLRKMMEPLLKGLGTDVEEQRLRISNYPDAPKYMTDELNRITERLAFLREQ